MLTQNIAYRGRALHMGLWVSLETGGDSRALEELKTAERCLFAE